MKNGFEVKIVHDEREIERIALFNKSIHEGEDLETLVRKLITEHPYGAPHHWLFIEKPKEQKVVASVALIPWKINVCGTVYRAAELGFVGTAPDYRHQGLTRILINRFHETVEREGFAFSFLQGIPYFYRQFGYEYALPLEMHINLKLNRIPAYQGTRLTVREMTGRDLAVVRRLYDRCMEDFSIHTERSLAVWKYLLGPSRQTEMVHDSYCVVDGGNRIIAYFRIARHGFGDGLIVDEASNVAPPPAACLLAFLKDFARERNKPYLRFNLPMKHDLVRHALACGARLRHRYAFQIRIGHFGRFLRATRPVLEKRVHDSAFAGLTGKVTLNLYKEAWSLEFLNGKIKKITARGHIGETDCMIPPFAAVQLFFGHRDLRELQEIYPDVWMNGEERKIIKILFPKLDSLLHTNY